MIDSLRQLQNELSALKKSLPKSQAAQVESASPKTKTKDLVDYYFRSVRPALANGGISDSSLDDIDLEMQFLLEHTHKRTRSAKYHASIKSIQAHTVQLEHLCLKIGSSASVTTRDISPTDIRIIETLETFLPSAAASYKQASIDLQLQERFSWRGPATDLREALRETLDHLAPDADVIGQRGYKPEPEARGPTMKQKVRYVLSKRGARAVETATTEAAASAIEEQVGSFVRSIYTRSSVSTHTPTHRDEVSRVRDLVRVALCELLEIPS